MAPETNGEGKRRMPPREWQGMRCIAALRTWAAAAKKFKKRVDKLRIRYYTNMRVIDRVKKMGKRALLPGVDLKTYGIEVWLSLVERCVRDAEVACSNHVASTAGRSFSEDI